MAGFPAQNFLGEGDGEFRKKIADPGSFFSCWTLSSYLYRLRLISQGDTRLSPKFRLFQVFKKIFHIFSDQEINLSNRFEVGYAVKWTQSWGSNPRWCFICHSHKSSFVLCFRWTPCNVFSTLICLSSYRDWLLYRFLDLSGGHEATFVEILDFFRFQKSFSLSFWSKK